MGTEAETGGTHVQARDCHDCWPRQGLEEAEGGFEHRSPASLPLPRPTANSLREVTSPEWAPAGGAPPPAMSPPQAVRWPGD